ncbi:PspC domain-containing protein [Candidatus Saccharibacteria bacterium]|nr:MAG: PspC domain-containing protein [Candidatus Saccharibacteria bacterium]
MKKVISISLAGRSYQVEEEGYSQLEGYLSDAEKRLKNNPDKEDIMADIEQSIADKCAVSLTAGKNVIAAGVVEKALAQVGTVEGGSEDEVRESESVSDNPRKLYALPKEGEIAGVCAGLAAYFTVDVTIMRLLFVLLLFLTQGLMILVYFAMAIAMPAAKTPEAIAEAHGKPGTAKEIVDKVKQAATDADLVTKIGTVISLVGKSVALVLMTVFAAGFVAVTVVWVWLLWAIGLGTLQFSDQLAVLNGWKQVVFATAVYVVVALPIFVSVRAMRKVANREKEIPGINTNIANSTIVVGIVLAAVTVFAFTSTYAPRVQDYADTHGGYLQIGEHKVCADENKCGDSAQYLKAHPEYRDENL